MKTLLIGSGGREHAIAWKLKRDGAKEIIAAPGNAGIAQIARCEQIASEDLAGIVDLAKREMPDLVVVGPEVPLAMGLADMLATEKIPVFGSTAKAARLESSKAFAKVLMAREGIPTAAFQLFDNCSEMSQFLRGEGKGRPWVVKADGLAAGKGSIVCPDSYKAQFWGHEMLVRGRFGEAGKRVVLEEKLEGREASVLFLCDGENFLPLPIAQDYKRAEDGDQGKNTGGMGSFAPAKHVTQELLAEVEKRVVAPVLSALRREGTPFRGVLYVGLMLTTDGPKVIEFNCRFGDPETQVILPIWPGNLAEALIDCIEGRIRDVGKPEPEGAAVCVVLAAAGYPDAYEKGIRLRFPSQEMNDAIVFHAGTQVSEDGIVSAGGRVLNAVGVGQNIAQASEKAYNLARRLRVPGLRFRKDIGRMTRQNKMAETVPLLGESEAMRQVRSLIAQVAPTDISVLILGESGTGKELVARQLHELSPRRAKPMLTVNCGAIPEGIFESEVFGHKRGAFTGADKNRSGYFELANGGTILLDEVGDIPLASQVKLLRVLENGEFMRVGSSVVHRVDVRILAATNRDLAHAVASGQFRQDLFYRLKTITITVPPLRERRDDIPLLVNHFLRAFCRRNRIPIPTFSADAEQILREQYWSGNVRELRNTVETVATLERGADTITGEMVRRGLSPASEPALLPVKLDKAPEVLERELIFRMLLDLRREVGEVKTLLKTAIEQAQDQSRLNHESTAMKLEEMEKEQIRRTLAEYGGNRRKTAQALGIGERTLYRKLKEYEFI